MKGILKSAAVSNYMKNIGSSLGYNTRNKISQGFQKAHNVLTRTGSAAAAKQNFPKTPVQLKAGGGFDFSPGSIKTPNLSNMARGGK